MSAERSREIIRGKMAEMKNARASWEQARTHRRIERDIYKANYKLVQAHDRQFNPAPSEEKRPRRTLMRFISDQSSKIVSGGFTAGNVALAAKAGLHPDMDTAAGLIFTAQSMGLYFANKYPTAAFRFAGVTGLLASAFLSAKGIDKTGAITDAWRVVSPLAGFGTTAILLGLQKEIARVAEKAAASRKRLMRAFASTQKYPVVLAAGVDGIGLIGMAISAFHNQDSETLGIVGAWILGEGGLVMSDPRLQALIRKRQERRVNHEPPTEKFRIKRRYNLKLQKNLDEIL